MSWVLDDSLIHKNQVDFLLAFPISKFDCSLQINLKHLFQWREKRNRHFIPNYILLKYFLVTVSVSTMLFSMLSSMWTETFWTSNLCFKREILFLKRAMMATCDFQLVFVISTVQKYAMRENYYWFVKGVWRIVLIIIL